MAGKTSRLGRGLGSLISGGISSSTPSAVSKKSTAKKSVSKKTVSKKAKKKAPIKKAQKKAPVKKAAPVAKKTNQMPSSPSGFVELPIHKIEPNPHQPRREFSEESIDDLANSIRSEGLLQPVVVRQVDEMYQLIAGERRWRACQKLQLKQIPARIIKASESSSAIISLIENLQRENLNPIEESLGFASLMRDFDLTQEQVSERLGKSRSAIANALRLLQLDREIQGYLSKGHLSVGHAKVLLSLEDNEHRVLLARRVIERGMSVRDTERMINALKAQKSRGGSQAAAKAQDATIQSIERRIASTLNTQVQLKHNKKKGKIVIDYFGNDDLQRILDLIGINI